jgi:hypothetical protein
LAEAYVYAKLVRRDSFLKSQFDLANTYPDFYQDERRMRPSKAGKIALTHCVVRCRAADLLDSQRNRALSHNMGLQTLKWCGWLVMSLKKEWR